MTKSFQYTPYRPIPSMALWNETINVVNFEKNRRYFLRIETEVYAVKLTSSKYSFGTAIYSYSILSLQIMILCIRSSVLHGNYNIEYILISLSLSDNV